MNALDPCPDDLLARAADTPLSPNERAQLTAHAARCASCRAAIDVSAAFRAEPIALAGDDVLVARLAAIASGPAPRRRRLSRRTRVAAIVVVLVGGAAAASLWSARRPNRRAAPEAPRAAATATPTPPPRPAVASTPTPAPTPAVPTTPAHPRLAARATDATGEALLRQARAARAAGDRARALELYRGLGRRFPGTPAAAVSDIAIGTLLLEGERGDPRGALAAFDRYLAGEPQGTLREEALAGRARALEASGDSAAASAAWRALLDEFPDSLHAGHARRRIETLADPR